MTEKLTCATCGDRIEDLASALVEWLATEGGAARFKVIHDMASSPRGLEGCSFHAFSGSDHPLESMPAPDFLGAAFPAQVRDEDRYRQVLVTLCEAALKSPDIPMRHRAALVLARLGDGAMSAAPSLISALGDMDDEVRFKAAFALKVLGGIDHRNRADAVVRELAPVMARIDALEPFVAASHLKRGLITEETDLVGEIVIDAASRVFLAPEEDYRGGGMGSVPLYGSRGRNGDLVRITGVFDRDVGIVADTALKVS